MRHNLTALILAMMAPHCIGQNGQCSSNAGQCAPIELTLADTSVRGTDFVLQYGLIRNDMTTAVKIGVRNKSDEPLAIRVSTTEDLLLTWSDGKPASQTLNASFAKNQQRWMSISFKPTPDDPIPIIRFSVGGVLTATLSLSFVAEDDRLPIQAGGSYAGSASSGASLCSGKPPSGYKLDCASVKVNGEKIPYPSGKCAKGVNCIVPSVPCETAADQHLNYCISVRPPPAGGVIHYDAILTAEYVLEEPSPQLMLLAEVEKANRLVQKKQECADDWNHFLDEHKSEAQFHVLSEAGQPFHFRSEPCDPLQSSFVGVPVNSEGQWADLIYAGLRIKCLGGPVLVGFVGWGEPLFNDMPREFLGLFEPQPSTAMEIMLIRDSKWVVATFAIGGETPDDKWGITFGIGSSLTAFDNPPPGTHTYTAKVRYVISPSALKLLPYLKSAYVGPRGRFIAYELPKGGSR
jgi:hypothetical protein